MVKVLGEVAKSCPYLENITLCVRECEVYLDAGGTTVDIQGGHAYGESWLRRFDYKYKDDRQFATKELDLKNTESFLKEDAVVTWARKTLFDLRSHGPPVAFRYIEEQ